MIAWTSSSKIYNRAIFQLMYSNLFCAIRQLAGNVSQSSR